MSAVVSESKQSDGMEKNVKYTSFWSTSKLMEDYFIRLLLVKTERMLHK